ncbi:TPA: DUF2758 domain-containing protein [Streptococcus pyogenes]|uniref:DUF2758 domain-containing protein n=1 Tax=Streptococcus pyogenes TaxID=1314 RepID=UPI0010A0EF59|nr:DUF2758 domain-containing protein [Streptococcus pyogenes]HER4799576.1 DUF2758 domain-containing protein [Streptococcus pyogenes NGAS113]QCK27794.1 DUF2758 domain-containing protein [Streptococcus pyogenes]HEP1449907.1 DUF2758 domain-containing protein [Streptococcus pyogenes]HEP1860036.1 DUF2758 domain-containing protein [Streptococcus pyogenes]HEP1889789.1 DUF2758 domain-containing protein [Streptococcus pyogenes]
MKIKILERQYKESFEAFEERINKFMVGVNVIDIKFSEATYGNYEDMSTTTSLLVLYR